MKGMFELLEEHLEMKPFKANTYSPLALAYIGDSIYDLVIRTLIMNRGNKAVGKMHKEASSYVNANTQNVMYHAVLPVLSEMEIDVLKRGRNAKSGRPPKNADQKAYKHATGFEALLGYLYLSNDMKRVVELIEIGLVAWEERKKEVDGK